MFHFHLLSTGSADVLSIIDSSALLKLLPEFNKEARRSKVE